MEMQKSNKKTMTSLELVEQINDARKLVSEKSNTKYSEYVHSDLLKKIREEKEVEKTLGFNAGNISCIKEATYKASTGKINPMFIIPLSRAKMLMASEVPAVRIVVAVYIEKIENALLEHTSIHYQESDNFKEIMAFKILDRNPRHAQLAACEILGLSSTIADLPQFPHRNSDFEGTRSMTDCLKHFSIKLTASEVFRIMVDKGLAEPRKEGERGNVLTKECSIYGVTHRLNDQTEPRSVFECAAARELFYKIGILK